MLYIVSLRLNLSLCLTLSLCLCLRLALSSSPAPIPALTPALTPDILYIVSHRRPPPTHGPLGRSSPGPAALTPTLTPITRHPHLSLTR